MKVRLDLFISIVLLISCCLLFWQISKFPPAILKNTPAPSYFPNLLVSGLTLLSILLFFQSIWRYKTSEILQVKKPVLIAISLAFLYVIAVPFIGYFLSTLMFFIFFSYLHNKAFSWLIVANSLIFMGFVFAFFYKTLGVPLPDGYFVELLIK